MKRFSSILTIIFLAVTCLLLAVPAGGSATGGSYRASELPLHHGYWTKTLNGGESDFAGAVSCNEGGDPFVAGRTVEGGQANIWVRKYRGTDGATIWTKKFDGGHGDDSAFGVSADPVGDAFVAGRTAGSDMYWDIWVRKYRGSDGAVLWTKTVDSGIASSVTSDGEGNAFVAGTNYTGTGTDIWVRKYRGTDGSTLWTKRYNIGHPYNMANGVSCGPDGCPVVAGSVFNGTTLETVVRKHSGSDGATLWTKTYAGGSGSGGNAVSCDSDGNAVVAGFVESGAGTDVWVRKYHGSDGSTLWTKTFDGTAHGNEEAKAVSCDPRGDVVVGGYALNGPSIDIWVRKYRGSDGSTLWTETYDGGYGKDGAHGVSCDSGNNPVVAGSVYNGSDEDAWVRKYPPGLSANSVWYLAEGSTGWGFNTVIKIENPNPDALTARVTYMTSTGPVPGGDIVLPAESQTGVDPRPVVGEADFSTKVECLEGKTIAVDRTMSWTGPGAPAFECHSSIGVVSPARRWFLAEGSSAWGFECWLLIQNPNATAAVCDVTYMIEGAEPVTVTKSVAANSRITFSMADDIGAKDASIMVGSNVPVIPERAMYRNSRREGHDSIGTTAPAPDYYLAEGTTAWGFTTYVLVQNPNATPADVTVTYMTTGGPQPQAPFTMPANSRKTIRVNDVLPDTDLSTHVHGTRPIIAERAMYWGADTPHGEATHDSIGMTSPHRTFYLPDGDNTMGTSTHQNIETWTLVQNPNDTSVDVEISYLRSGGGAVSFTDNIPADSRKTYNMAYHIPLGSASIVVECLTPGKKVMAERAMYWRSIDVQYRVAGTDTIGGYED